MGRERLEETGLGEAGIGEGVRGPLSVLLRLLAAERGRWMLWSPVGLGAGIAIYFALPFEPRPASLLAPSLLVLLLGVAAIRRRAWLVLALPLLGFVLAAARTAEVAAPALGAETGPVEVSGRVLQATPGEGKRRLLLDRLDISRLPPDRVPARVRITIRGDQPAPEPGSRVRLRAALLPPPPPQMPGGFDFPRQAWFQRLGAVGYALGPWRTVEPAIDEPPHGLRERAMLGINALRQHLAERILNGVEGPAGGIAAALLTGERARIDEEINRAMQDAGLAHLLAISGLHLAMVAGIVFYVARLLLACIPALSLRWPIKKWAAGLALLGGFFYMLLTGAAVPTQRAFIMSAIALVGLMLDRGAISMRLIAWAAILVLAMQPESLLEISFQMSFAAVVALIAAYESWSRSVMPRERRWPVRVLRHLAQVLASTLVASLATAPFALHYFGRFVDYGLLANLLAVPLTGFVIMPAGLLALLLIPFGLEGPALAVMGAGVDLVIATARWVATLPGAVQVLPQLPLPALLSIVLGGLWLCLWRRRWRRLGGIAIGAGLMLGILWPRPDILIEGEGRLVAVRDRSGTFIFSAPPGRSRTGETWLRAVGQAEGAVFPRIGASTAGALRCDGEGCIHRLRGHLVALPRSDGALVEDCRTADIVIVPDRSARRCPGARHVIDRTELRREGAHAIHLGADGAVRIETVAGWRGERPWSAPARPFSSGAAGRRGGPGSAPGPD
ncbi:MAG: ComEC/Rec2 family competence protein [Alphaproteobacteria bacterium]|nr:ComEC/Rec2 family competence protein [Alphaproteobacteria bacterium]